MRKMMATLRPMSSTASNRSVQDSVGTSNACMDSGDLKSSYFAVVENSIPGGKVGVVRSICVRRIHGFLDLRMTWSPGETTCALKNIWSFFENVG